MKTSELQGAALDWAVAKCEGYETLMCRGKLETLFTENGWTPSTNWEQGGPIIEREKIGLHCGDGTWGVAEGKWEASHPECLYVEHGTTPLIAAMRCYVASKMGDEIEVPEDLLEGA